MEEERTDFGKMVKRLIIIPAYNEVKNLDKVISDLRTNAENFDYLIINDCSADDTAAFCKERGYPVLNLPVNLGIGGAVQTGYLYACQNGYQVVVQFDGDGQHKAIYLEDMYRMMMESGSDLVIGSRFIEKEGFQSSGIRRVGIRYFSFLIRLLTRQVILDPTSGMRMARGDLISYFAEHYPKDYPEPEVIVAAARLKKKITEYPVKMKERTEGVSSISATKSIYYMIKVTLAIFVEILRR